MTMCRYVIICSICFCLLIPGCSRQEDSPPDASMDLLNAQDDPNQRLTISWLGMPRFVEGKEGSWIEQRLEERFNIELKPIFVDWNAMLKRKPLMLLGGDVPDVTWVMDPRMIAIEARHGFLLELPYEFIAKYAPDYIKVMNQYDRTAWLTTYHQGKNYGLPTFGADYNHLYPTPSVWRRDWLRVVGIDKIPETLDEMHEAFYRFRYNDPDGNGIKDTYGFSCKPSQFDTCNSEFFAAFNLRYMNWQVRDGKVVWGGVLPETKKVLRLLRQWQKEELLEPEWAIANHLPGILKNKFFSGRVGYAPLSAMKHNMDRHAPGTIANIFYKMNPQGEMVPAVFPIGPQGHRGKIVRGGAQYIMAFGKHLAREPQKVIRVLRMFNEIAKDDTLALETRLGKRGLHWEFSPDKGIYRLPPYDEEGLAKREVFNLIQPDPASGWGFFVPFGARLELTDQYLTKGTRDFRARYRRPEWGVRAVINRNSLPSAPQYMGELGILRQMQGETIAKIITGEEELDYFDTFVEQWYQNGGERLTREANEMYKIQEGIIKRANSALQE